MRADVEYGGIGCFRVVAALRIITIHTSPLASLSATADFILSRIAACVRVPFFFAATRFFLLPRLAGGDAHPLRRLLCKCGWLYLAATLLYLPLLAYSGYFRNPGLPLVALKDVAFDGTFYHLWYLPAAMLGAVLAALLVRKGGLQAACAVVALLCVFGLLGGSYYGLAARLPWLAAAYGQAFRLFGCTRNGLFFAPIYLLLGVVVARQAQRLPRRLCLLGLQRHDSMYVFLLPVTYFLCHALLWAQGRGGRAWRDASMLIYLIHPLCIVLVRGGARLAGLWSLFVDNSMLHFAAVAASSLLPAALLPALTRRLRLGCVRSSGAQDHV